MKKREEVKELDEIMRFIDELRNDIDKRHQHIYSGEIFEGVGDTDEKDIMGLIAEIGEYASKRLREDERKLNRMIDMLRICQARTLEDIGIVEEKTTRYMHELGMRRKGEKSLFDYGFSRR